MQHGIHLLSTLHNTGGRGAPPGTPHQEGPHHGETEALEAGPLCSRSGSRAPVSQAAVATKGAHSLACWSVLTSRPEMGRPCPGRFQPTIVFHCRSPGGWERLADPVPHIVGWGHSMSPRHTFQGLCSRLGHSPSGHTKGTHTPEAKRHMPVCPQAHMITRTDTCRRKPSHTHAHTHTHLRGRPPGHRSRQEEVGWRMSCPCLWAWPPHSTHEHMGAGVGLAKGAPACATRGDHSRHAACMHVWPWACKRGRGHRYAPSESVCAPSVCACTHWGSVGMHVHQRCASVQSV